MALIVQTTANASAGTPGTGPTVDSTGGTGIYIIENHAFNGADDTKAPTDSYSNTYVQVAAPVTSGSFCRLSIWYCENPTVGAAHNWTVSTQYGALSISVHSGTLTSSSLDQKTGAAVASTPAAPGSITPTTANQLVIAGFGEDTIGLSDTISINGGFATPNTIQGTGFAIEPVSLSYLLQTSAAAANPSWTYAGVVAAAAVIASFKTSGGAAAAPFVPNTLQNPARIVSAAFLVGLLGSPLTLTQVVAPPAPFFKTDWSNPSGPLRGLQAQSSPASPSSLLTGLKPFNKLEWYLPTGALPRTQTQPLGTPFAIVVGILPAPFFQTVWPVPVGPPRQLQAQYSGSLPAYLVTGLKPNSLSDWPVPPGPLPRTQTQPLGTAAYRFPVVLPYIMRQSDWPNPRGPAPLQQAQCLGATPSALLTGLKPFNQNNWHVPPGPRFAVRYINSYQVTMAAAIVDVWTPIVPGTTSWTDSTTSSGTWTDVPASSTVWT